MVTRKVSTMSNDEDIDEEEEFELEENQLMTSWIELCIILFKTYVVLTIANFNNTNLFTFDYNNLELISVWVDYINYEEYK